MLPELEGLRGLLLLLKPVYCFTPELPLRFPLNRQAGGLERPQRSASQAIRETEPRNWVNPPESEQVNGRVRKRLGVSWVLPLPILFPLVSPTVTDRKLGSIISNL